MLCHVNEINTLKKIKNLSRLALCNAREGRRNSRIFRYAQERGKGFYLPGKMCLLIGTKKDERNGKSVTRERGFLIKARKQKVLISFPTCEKKS